jgi:exopolyphosphatase/guanosine-5'-triphosphate,3'-diphosphate pyrophosphatase
VLDIGGGSLEMSTGAAEEPEVALSLPLGAGRLTRDWLPDDPPAPRQLRALDRYVTDQLEAHRAALLTPGQPDLAVATSKTFRSLARIGGAAPYRDGMHARRRLTYSAARHIRRDVASLSAAQRARLPGVSPARASQLAAGAVVAEAAMRLFGIKELHICPWALREGVILRRLDWTE